MEAPERRSDARSLTTGRDGSTPAGVAGYVAALVGALALLSAPVLVGAALAAAAAVGGLVRWVAGRPTVDATGTATRRAPAVESVSD